MQATRLYTILLASLCFSAITLLGGFNSIANAQTITHVPLYTFNGDSVGDRFGVSVSGAGDVNGDGRADLIVGARSDGTTLNISPINGFPTPSGSARVFSGIDGSELYLFDGGSDGDDFGTSVSSAGDVNGDGTADFIVGENDIFNTGSARVLSGIDGRTLYSLNGAEERDRFGRSVSNIGDVNGDGRADLVVGAFGADNNGDSSGSVRVFSGINGRNLYTVNGDSATDQFGFSVSGAGDVNGDGIGDFIAGAFLDDNNGPSSGSARVCSGTNGSTIYSFNGDSSGDTFGSSVSGAGDVNGDGRADLIVGARLDDNNGTDSGSARVLSGIDGSILYTFNGDSARDQFGFSVSDAGDVNGDGFADLIVGATRDGNGGTAWVFSGIDGSPLYIFDGDGGFFGSAVSGAGDVNGDGIDDFIVGAENGGANGGGYARVFVSQISDPLSTTAGSGTQITQGAFSVTNEFDSNNSPLSSATEFQILHSEVFTEQVTIDAVFIDLANAQSNPLYRNSETSILRSDIVELTGLDGLLHVVDLSIDSTDGVGELVWLTEDGTSQWVNAVLGNSNITGLELDPAVELGDTPLVADDLQTTVAAYLDTRRFDGSYDDYLASLGGLDPELGAFGAAAGRAWAVIDHNSSFSVTEVAVVEVLLGDVDLDGDVDFSDIPAFIAVLQSGNLQAEADCNEDGAVDFADIPVFISILIEQ